MEEDTACTTTTTEAATAQQRQQKQRCVGCDAEWPPGRPDLVSLLQVATRNEVFLFDMLRLMGGCQDTRQQTVAVLQRLFRSSSVVKVGYKFGAHDLVALDQSFPDAQLAHGVQNLVDIEALFVNDPEYFCGGKQGQRRLGLSSVCEAVLGRGLDKTQQCTDWGQRPLTPEQLTYAALDASCLLSLVDKLRPAM
eukprot:CAMPEP_0185790350 /NCGR_PEP_ID=MMETSP1174-20130828/155695_1 /TAXON_ID=35687 /ORGANISM="Dictyocha speculum, Strain CCMP1381" /LENGTH=193 /DNA_ID=CAMNT_0028484973 /DNA_START=21 /DNA_END=602 /DNA_ORIENTATION=+